MSGTYSVIRASGIRNFCKENGKRCSKEFLQALDKWTTEKVARCVAALPGAQKTLDASTVVFTK